MHLATRVEQHVLEARVLRHEAELAGVERAALARGERRREARELALAHVERLRAFAGEGAQRRAGAVLEPGRRARVEARRQRQVEQHRHVEAVPVPEPQQLALDRAATARGDAALAFEQEIAEYLGPLARRRRALAVVLQQRGPTLDLVQQQAVAAAVAVHVLEQPRRRERGRCAHAPSSSARSLRATAYFELGRRARARSVRSSARRGPSRK
jgi:hypothetical protein